MQNRCFCLIFIFWGVFLCGCFSDEKKVSFSEIVPDVQNNVASVFVFLSPDCPLSQKYTRPLKRISEKYQKNHIVFYSVFPGNFYSEKEINDFLMKYELNFSLIFDTNKQLTNKLGATVTPEIFLVDSCGKIIYSGAVDNWYEEIGKKREVITQNYLQNAIEAFLKKEPVKIPQTKAVGCIIE